MWRSDGGRGGGGAPVHREALGSNNSRAGIAPGPHLHFTPATGAETAHIRYAFNFSLGYYGAADLRDSAANFPSLSDVRSTRPFHAGEMTALPIILS